MFFVGTPSTMNFNTQLNNKKPISIIYMYSLKKTQNHVITNLKKIRLSFHSITQYGILCVIDIQK